MTMKKKKEAQKETTTRVRFRARGLWSLVFLCFPRPLRHLWRIKKRRIWWRSKSFRSAMESPSSPRPFPLRHHRILLFSTAFALTKRTRISKPEATTANRTSRKTASNFHGATFYTTSRKAKKRTANDFQTIRTMTTRTPRSSPPLETVVELSRSLFRRTRPY